MRQDEAFSEKGVRPRTSPPQTNGPRSQRENVDGRKDNFHDRERGHPSPPEANGVLSVTGRFGSSNNRREDDERSRDVCSPPTTSNDKHRSPEIAFKSAPTPDQSSR